jgi:PAS domain S-box-containing protein
MVSTSRLSVKFPSETPKARIYAVGGIATDVTQLRAAETAIAESERKYRLLFEGNPNPMWLYEAATLRILAVNTAAVVKYGYSRDEFLTMTISDLRFPEDLAPLHAALQRIGDNYDESGPWRHRRKDGSYLLVHIISHVINFEGRRARLVLPIDVTERLAAESDARESAEKLRQLNQDLERRVAVRTGELLRAKERAEAADRVKSVFLATMSHELRTPLSSIIGFSDLLLSQADGPLNDAQRHQVEIVQDAGRHLLGLISDVLDISRIEAGALSLRMEDVEIGDVLRDEAEFMQEARARPAARFPRARVRRAGVGPRRRAPCAADRREPAVERGQVHRSRVRDADTRGRRDRRTRDRRGHGDRHRACASRRDLRAVQAGRNARRGGTRRRRSWAVDRGCACSRRWAGTSASRASPAAAAVSGFTLPLAERAREHTEVRAAATVDLH